MINSDLTRQLDLTRLHARLTAEADSAGLLDIAYTTLDSPVGSLLLAATERGLVRVAFARENHDRVLEVLATRLSLRVLRSATRLDQPRRQLEDYFGGHRTHFELTVDFALSSGFRQQVQANLGTITYGHTQSYGEVAQIVGHPKAARAVGSACATNPLPIVLPCHRVVRSDGSLGDYVGGLDAKSALLALERSQSAERN